MSQFIPKSIHRIWEWLTFADYEAEKEREGLAVVTRYSRGNVVTQNGWTIEECDLDELTKAGDKATKFLIGKMPTT